MWVLSPDERLIYTVQTNDTHDLYVLFDSFARIPAGGVHPVDTDCYSCGIGDDHYPSFDQKEQCDS